LPAAYALHVRGGRLARMLEEIITLPLAVPGLAIALALLLTYGGFSDFRRSWLFILAGHVVFTLPFMVRAVMAVLAAFDVKTLDESAASLGAGPWRRFRDVIVPNARPGILAGALTVVTLSLGEFNLTWMLHTPLTKTLPVGLADSYASMRLEVASAYTLVFFVMIIPLLVAMQLFADRAGAAGARGAGGARR
jgi:putative spermidine/putrescine transport system permease protein